MTPTQQIATEFLRKFPTTHTKTLATMIYREYPQMFTSVEGARSIIRGLRGANGKRNIPVKIKEFVREASKPGDPFLSLPKPRRHFDSWGAVQIDGPLKALVLSDIHIPYHDLGALEPAIEVGKARDIDTVLLNGDTADFFSCSFWEKDPRERDLAGEIKTVKEFLAYMRQTFPKARIIFKLGNHEDRWVRYLSVKAPELLGVADFELKNVLGFDAVGVEQVAELRPIRLGKLNVIHGHEYKFSISNPVNPARGFFLRAKTHVLGGHLHQSSQHSEKNLEGKVVSAWSTGCLCDLHPDYSPLNNWSHGFAIVEVCIDGRFEVSNLRVIDRVVY